MPSLDESLQLIFTAIDTALIESLGTLPEFSEDVLAGETRAIADPNRWNRIANDQVEVSGNIWIVSGVNSYPEARSRGLTLSSAMVRAERACRDTLKTTLPQYLQGASLFFVQTQTGEFLDWGIEISGKLDNAHQKAPWMVQIRPQFELIVVDRMWGS